MEQEVIYQIWHYLKMGHSISLAKRKTELLTKVSSREVQRIYMANEELVKYVRNNKRNGSLFYDKN